MQLMAQHAYHDGQADELLTLAAKAIEQGKFEKAAAYAATAHVHQLKADAALVGMRGQRGTAA